MRRFQLAIAVLHALGCVTFVPSASAQSQWPTKPVRIIVPFAAGGGTDIAARHLQPLLAAELGQAIIIENKGGGGGIVGTEALVRAAPDGHTFGMIVSSHASNPALNKTMPYDAIKDVKPVTILFRATNVWVAHPSAPYTSLADIIAAAKAAPGKLSVVTSGTGTAQHLGLEQLKLLAGIDVVHVPYRGAGPALSDLQIGQVQIGVLNISSTLPPIKDGRLKGIAVTSGSRSVYAPEIASVADTIPGFDSVEWFAFIAPAGVPDEIVQKFYAAIVKSARSAQYAEKVKEMGVELVLNEPADFGKVIAADVAKFADLVKRAGIKLD